MRRRGDIQVFSVSFLDVLSCALGGVLLLLLLNLEQSNQQTRSFAKQVQYYDAEIKRQDENTKNAQQALRQAERDAAEAKTSRDALAQAAQDLEAAQAALVGLQGDMENVVFVFDTSSSMATARYTEYRGILKSWVAELRFEEFNVLQFDDTVRSFEGGLVDASVYNRERAAEWIDRLRPDGSATRTQLALERALSQSRVDTIVLFSDGQPTDGSSSGILAWLRRNNPDVTINTVALGNYFREEYGEFLQMIAKENRGVFIGR